MGRRACLLLTTALLLAGCATHPRDTILSLNMDSAKFRSPGCRYAREMALRYDEKPLTKTAVAVAGNLMAPYAGTAASLALSARDAEKREEVNRRIAENCMEDPDAKRAERSTRRNRF